MTLILVFFDIISPYEITSTLLPLIFTIPDSSNVVMATPSADKRSSGLSVAGELPFSESITLNLN